MEKIKTVFDLLVSILTFLFVFILFSLMSIVIILSLMDPFSQSIEYSLDWLSKEYPRDIKRFEVNTKRIRYTISHDQVKERWDFPLKKIGNFTKYKTKFWRLSDNDSLIVDFRKTFFVPIICLCFMALFGAACYNLGNKLRFWLKEKLQKRGSSSVPKIPESV